MPPYKHALACLTFLHIGSAVPTGVPAIRHTIGGWRRRLDWPMARVWNTRWGDKPLERSNRSASALPPGHPSRRGRPGGLVSEGGRARWGVGGSLNSKSAARETEFPPAAPRACGKRLASGAEGWVPREPAS